MSEPVSRRAVIRTTALVGGGATLALLLTACGSSPAAPATPGGPVTLDAGQVPVGGGIVLPSHNIVVTQPQAGSYHAFSAICTHQGCPVSSVETRGMFCACHSSYFDIATGTPVAGPATTPLPELSVGLSGATLSIS